MLYEKDSPPRLIIRAVVFDRAAMRSRELGYDAAEKLAAFAARYYTEHRMLTSDDALAMVG